MLKVKLSRQPLILLLAHLMSAYKNMLWSLLKRHVLTVLEKALKLEPLLLILKVSFRLYVIPIHQRMITYLE